MLRRYKKMPMPELLNDSINSTLSRSIITHVTVTLALLALLLFGGHAIHSFTATMMFGVVLVGTYTSIFIAAPILIYLGVGTNRADAPEDKAGEAVEDSSHGRAPRTRRIFRARRRSRPMAMAASPSPACRIAARCCACRAIWAWPVTRPEDIDEVSLQRGVRERGRHRHVDHRHRHATSGSCRRGLRERFREVKVVIDAMQTGPAIRTYNIMIGERRRVAAALIAVP